MAKPATKAGKHKGPRKPPIPGKRKSVANSHTSPSKIKRAKKIAEALDYRLQGHSYPKIAEAMGEPVSTVFTYVSDGLKQIVREPAEALREIELERVDVLLAAVFADAAEGDDTKINTTLRVMERRAKLLGLDKPEQLDVSAAVATANMTGAPSDTDRARQLAAFIAMTRARKEAEQGSGEKE